MRIACLHTADSNIDVFEAALAEMNTASVTLIHRVRPDLLAAAQRHGGPNAEIARQTVAALAELAIEADAALLTCSTLGPSIPTESADQVPLLRVDHALAREATRAGGSVVVLCAAEATLAPTTELFIDAAKASGATVEIRLVPGAWSLFINGDLPSYLESIAAAARQAYGEGIEVVALAQASMSGARKLIRGASMPLCSPVSSLRAAIAAVSER